METGNLKTQLENILALLRLQALNNKLVFTIDELVLYTGFSKLYIYKLTHRKEIPYYPANGKKIFFKKDEIDLWLLRNRQATNKEIELEAINHTVIKAKSLL